MKANLIQSKIKLHDGIVGLTYLLSIVLAVTVNIQWLYLAGVVAVLQIMSAFTGFCPVYFVLNKIMIEDEPAETKSDEALA
ncbi:MAG: DUF2892 domain-containing protein [Cyclonatronaceae bacterium]